MGDVRWRKRRRSLGAALTFAVAAGAGVVGNQLTGGLTVALLVFAVLVFAGMLLTYLVDRGATDQSTDRSGESEAAGEADSVDLRGAQGVQIGDGNVQHNLFSRDNDD